MKVTQQNMKGPNMRMLNPVQLSVRSTYHVRMHVDLKVSPTQISVPVVCDVTTVHNLSKQVT